ncbi:MAG: bacillithiol transferase BstA [Candidatus Pseudobacter hemicellulosilyticus]|uniref:Bacillithiol transferase BstA n=1 Tax=Candidatus Pseudobacter hemicellulosilyticus TaxID=3121375 RepID=A0AAJ5WQ05_9BACT|nr:MAG: bacillithiol transferase BstA [Pseudobacter sp.]
MDLRYPIGHYEPQPFSPAIKRSWLQDIQFLPGLLEQAIENLDEKQLLTPYREGGWSLKQVVHHVADSHINAYTRMKLGLTEDKPVIKPYDEKAWATLADVDTTPINISITLLYTLHTRWHATLLLLTDEQWKRCIIHPEQNKELSLWYLLGSYAWHGKHHVAHITSLRERKGW